MFNACSNCPQIAAEDTKELQRHQNTPEYRDSIDTLCSYMCQPRFRACQTLLPFVAFETTAEALRGLVTAYEHFAGRAGLAIACAAGRPRIHPSKLDQILTIAHIVP